MVPTKGCMSRETHLLLQPPRKHRTLAWPYNRRHDCFLVKSATSTRHAYSPPAREVFCLMQQVRKQTQEGGPLVQVLGALGGEGYHPRGGGGVWASCQDEPPMSSTHTCRLTGKGIPKHEASVFEERRTQVFLPPNFFPRLKY